MRKERQALATRVEDELHLVEAAMHELQIKYARLQVTLLEVRQQARLSPLVGNSAIASHSEGSSALAAFAGHIYTCHMLLKDAAGVWMPETLTGDTPARPDVIPPLAAVA